MPEPDLPKDPGDAIALGHAIGAHAGRFSADHDRDSSFVTEGFEAIRELGYGALAVPTELGGAGHTLDTICRAQAAMAAGCASTSLAIAMHQHNVLTLAWLWGEGNDAVEPILREIADGLLVCSSGASDLSNPGVTAVPVEGGLKATGRKGLASGVPGCGALGTPIAVSAGDETYVASAYIPLDDTGATIADNWDAMGMRGSGSNGVEFVDAFVPQRYVVATQPRPAPGTAQSSARHDPFRQPSLMIALPVIAAVYLGIADGVQAAAIEDVRGGRHSDDPITHRLAGEMTHELRIAWWALDGLLAETTDDSVDTEKHFVTTMVAKRQIVLGAIRVVETAIEMLGSMAYLRRAPYEQALRDVRAGITHPLAPDATLTYVGRSVITGNATSE